jgi:tartrate-resistant acid phosphatase type 5
LGIPTGKNSGDEDDDWFFTYFQPYRYLLNRIPVFPAVGNHDEEENEKSIDRQQIYDNLYLQTQFNQLRSKQDCSMEFGLFYRFGFGRDAEFICLDTSKSKSGKRYFDLPDNAPFIRHCLAGSAPAWRFVYSHHPAYCAGPRHESSLSLRRLLMEHPEVRVSFSGHEHNFQYARDGAQHHFLTGGGGKYRAEKLSSNRLADNKCEFWGGNDEGHFLLVTIRDNKQMEVNPYGFLKNQKLNRIALNPAHGDPFLILQ